MKKHMQLAILGALAIGLAMPAAADAQISFGFGGRSGGFSVGIGGGSRSGGGGGGGGFNFRFNAPGGGFNNPGHRYHSNSPGWGTSVTPSWSGSNNWSRPRPSYAYSQPAPYVVARPQVAVAAAPALATPPAEPILISNPAPYQTVVHYKVNEYPYIMSPGTTQQLGGHTGWTIDYDRGSNYGRQSYSLIPGKVYRFTPGPRGWELFVVKPEAPPFQGFAG